MRKLALALLYTATTALANPAMADVQAAEALRDGDMKKLNFHSEPQDAGTAEFITFDGDPLSLSDWNGKWVLVNFWATWCAPCVREMPLLQDLADQYPDRLNVVGIAIDEPGNVGEFVERLGIDYPILIGTSDVRETQARFGNPNGMLPYSVLIDARGIVRWTHLGELEENVLRDTLQPFVATVPSTPPAES